MFESLNKNWEDRALENQSLRSIFCYTLAAVFLSGAEVALGAYQILRLHRFSWGIFAGNFLILGPLVFRGTRLIYRRLGP
jgi:hypothetical protein